jgi:hypothetical protein
MPLLTADTTTYARRDMPTVGYRNARGTMMDAIVIGPGTNSGVKLRLLARDVVVDDVPKATTMKSTGAYFLR